MCRDIAGVRVLDLGCGTGVFAASLGASRQVVGVDASAEMLQVAAAREGGDRVTWVCADARTVRLNTKFDLVVLTGHSFQVFLDSAAQRAVLQTIAAHLAPEGQFIFDSRNPAFAVRKERTAAETRTLIQAEGFGAVEMWNLSNYDESTGILNCENHYRILDTDVVHSGADQILYTHLNRLESLCAEAGLRITRKMGAWDGREFTQDAPEIILVGGLARPLDPSCEARQARQC